MSDPCPALRILRGTVYRTTPSGRLIPREPEHAVDIDGRCRHCNTTVVTRKTPMKERRNG